MVSIWVPGLSPGVKAMQPISLYSLRLNSAFDQLIRPNLVAGIARMPCVFDSIAASWKASRSG